MLITTVPSVPSTHNGERKAYKCPSEVTTFFHALDSSVGGDDGGVGGEGGGGEGGGGEGGGDEGDNEGGNEGGGGGS